MSPAQQRLGAAGLNSCCSRFSATPLARLPGFRQGQARRKRSEYAIRLEEKQKLRFNYGISERQLVRYVKKARAQEGSTGTNLLKLLESRLDNVCFRLGFGPTVPGDRRHRSPPLSL
jgi:ribosomal protein S4